MTPTAGLATERPRTRRTRRGAGTVLVGPALLLTVAVAVAAVSSLALTATGLMPLVGAPHATADAFRTLGPDLGAAAGQSLLIASASTGLAATGGLVMALLVLQTGPGTRLLTVAVAAPVPVAHLVGAASMGLLLSDSGLLNRLLGANPGTWPHLVGGRLPVAVIAEFAWKESAFVALVICAALAPDLRSHTEAATLLGATPGQRLRTVTMPLAMPALVAASVIVFLYTLGSYEVAWLLGPATPETLPVSAYRLFSSVDLGARPAAAATALTVTTMSAVAGAAAVPLLRRLDVLR